MAHRVKWAPSAWNDVEEVAAYISKDSARYAAAFVREMRDAARSLALFPNRGRIVPEIRDAAIREIFVRRYRLIYQVSSDTVVVIRVIHGARDLKSHFKRD